MAALVLGMIYNFYFVKYYKNSNNSVTTETSEKISADLESLKF
jgi:hypothetical protein